jgi:hypothetical protein
MCSLAGSENVRSFYDTSLVASGGLFHAGVVSSPGKVLHILWGSIPLRVRNMVLRRWL